MSGGEPGVRGLRGDLGDLGDRGDILHWRPGLDGSCDVGARIVKARRGILALLWRCEPVRRSCFSATAGAEVKLNRLARDGGVIGVLGAVEWPGDTSGGRTEGS
jgi:hypothetical protein